MSRQPYAAHLCVYKIQNTVRKQACCYFGAKQKLDANVQVAHYLRWLMRDSAHSTTRNEAQGRAGGRARATSAIFCCARLKKDDKSIEICCVCTCVCERACMRAYMRVCACVFVRERARVCVYMRAYMRL